MYFRFFFVTILDVLGHKRGTQVPRRELMLSECEKIAALISLIRVGYMCVCDKQQKRYTPENEKYRKN